MDSWRAANVPQLPGRGPATLLSNTATGQLTVATAGPGRQLVCLRDHPVRRHPHRARRHVPGLGPAGPGLERDAGYQVSYVQNVTDVDDPLLERADRDGEDWRAVADREIDRYRGDMAALRVLPRTGWSARSRR